MATLHIMMGNTTRPALTASCLKTPPSSLTEKPKDGIYFSSVSLNFLSHLSNNKLLINFSGCLFLSFFCPLSSDFPLTPSLNFSCPSFKARTGKLEPSELETFKKQAECLNFSPEYHFGGSGQLIFYLRALPAPN